MMPQGCKLNVLFFLLYFPLCSLAQITTCPPVDLIERVPGENGWNTLFPGWDGRYEAPLLGQGFSSKVTRFESARWLQLNNLPDSPGKVQCYYDGNYDSEVIRFDQANSISAKRPRSEYWVCKVGGTFPSTICECSMGVEFCEFDSDVSQAVVDIPVLEQLDSEYHK